MTTEEMNAIFSLADINKDGKLDYAEVSLNVFYVSMKSIFSADPVAFLHPVCFLCTWMQKEEKENRFCCTTFESEKLF